MFNDCPAILDAMDRTEWQLRAKRAGLSQKALAGLMGFAENTVSRQLRGLWESGVPRHIKAAIIAWELMTPDQRNRWIAEVESSADGHS
jgi:transcriptional regulator with XRE-family HTH domain